MYPLGTKRKMANASIDTETDPSAQKTSAPASKATGADRRFGVMSRAESANRVQHIPGECKVCVLVELHNGRERAK